MDAERRAEDAARAGADRLARALTRINERAQQDRSRGLMVPELAADPEEGDPTSLWVMADGRLCWRTSDGLIHRSYPEGQRPYPILSRSSNPAASTGIDFYRHGPTGELRVRRPDGSWEAYAAISPTASGEGGGNSGGGSTSTKAKTSGGRPRKYSQTWSATWGRAYCPRHGAEAGGQLYYGDSSYSRSHGFRRIMLGLDDADIRSQVGGGVVRGVYIRMRNAHSHLNSGVDVHFGGHGRSSIPGGYSSVRERVYVGHWPKGGFGNEWRRVPNWFGERLASGAINGITIRQPSSASQFYGAMDPDSFRIRIVWSS